MLRVVLPLGHRLTAQQPSDDMEGKMCFIFPIRILAWAAQEGRILLTHDVRTMPSYAAERLRKGQAMPGLILVPQLLPIGRAINDLLLIAQCSPESKYEGIILRLPL